MVKGIESFREWFYGYEEAYALMGEAACDLLLGERGLDAGTVKELDLIPIDQAEDSPFRKRFSDYVFAAGYESSEEKDTAAFDTYAHPLTGDDPRTLHFFREEFFDGDYDSLIRQERTKAAGVSVLTVPCLIVLEAKAWMDLSERREAGGEIRSREIERHKTMVFSLTRLLPGKPEPLQMPDRVKSDMETFLKRMETENVSLRQIGILGADKAEVLKELREVFADGIQ